MSDRSRRLAGILLIAFPAVVFVLRYVGETALRKRARAFVRHAVPAAAILLPPTAFFLSVLSPRATEPNALIALAYVGAAHVGAALLVAGLLTLGHSPDARLRRRT